MMSSPDRGERGQDYGLPVSFRSEMPLMYINKKGIIFTLETLNLDCCRPVKTICENTKYNRPECKEKKGLASPSVWRIT